MFVPLTRLVKTPSPDIIIATRSIIILVINPLMKGYCIRTPTAREGAPSILRWVGVEDDDDNAAQQSSIPADGLRPIKSTLFSSRHLHPPALPLCSPRRLCRSSECVVVVVVQ